MRGQTCAGQHRERQQPALDWCRREARRRLHVDEGERVHHRHEQAQAGAPTVNIRVASVDGVDGRGSSTRVHGGGSAPSTVDVDGGGVKGGERPRPRPRVECRPLMTTVAPGEGGGG